LIASVHLPRIGYGLPNVNWYGVERVVKKCLSNVGLKTLVYYFPRKGAIKQQNWQPKPSKSTPQKTTRNDMPTTPTTPSKDDDDDRDVFEDLKICFYEAGSTEQKSKLKRSIIANGGVGCEMLDPTVSVVVTALDQFDQALEQFSQANKNIPIKNAEWINACVKANKILGARLVNRKLLRDENDPKYEVTVMV
jgi:hypothetical protein